jgi:hypothetical protein
VNKEDGVWFRSILGNTDEYYQAKFTSDGEVKAGWSYQQWTLDQVAHITPFPSRDCHTALRACDLEPWSLLGWHLGS